MYDYSGARISHYINVCQIIKVVLRLKSAINKNPPQPEKLRGLKTFTP